MGLLTADSVNRSEGFVFWDVHEASFTAANSLRKIIPTNKQKRKKIKRTTK